MLAAASTPALASCVHSHGRVERAGHQSGLQQKHPGAVRDGLDQPAHREATCGVQEEAYEPLGLEGFDRSLACLAGGASVAQAFGLAFGESFDPQVVGPVVVGTSQSKKKHRYMDHKALNGDPQVV